MPHTWCIRRVAKKARSRWFPEKGFWALPGSLGHPEGQTTGLGKWQDSRRKICSESRQKCLRTVLYVSCMYRGDRKKTEKGAELERVKEELACPGSTWTEEQTKTDVLPRSLRGSLSMASSTQPHLTMCPSLPPTLGHPLWNTVQCQKESKDLSRLVRLHIHHEKGSDDFIENRESFFSCTPEFVDYVRRLGHPGNGHSSLRAGVSHWPLRWWQRSIYSWPCWCPFFSFPPFWQKHCTNPSWIVVFMRLCLHSAKQSVIIKCEVGLVCRKGTSLLVFAISSFLKHQEWKGLENWDVETKAKGLVVETLGEFSRRARESLYC